MDRIKLLTIAVIALLLLNFGTLALMVLQKPDFRSRELKHKRDDEGPKQLIIDRLHFNEAQQKQYDIFVDIHRTNSRALNKQSRQLHDELYSLLKQPQSDKLKTDSIITLIARNQMKIDHLNYDHFEQIRSICKNEQIQYFNDLVADLTKLFSPQHPPK